MKEFLNTCYVCGDNLTQLMFASSDWKIYKCKQCSLLNKVGKKTNYEALDLREYLPFDYDRSKEVAQLCKAIKKYYPDITGLNIIEIGAGTGAILKEFQNRGANVYGYEPSQFATEHAIKKYGITTIVNGYFKNNSFGVKPHVFLLLDVVEHIENPLELFRNIYGAMERESILIVKSGDYETIITCFYLERWSYIHLPQHIAIYCRKSLDYLCNKSKLHIEIFYRYRDTYGQNSWKKFLKNIIKLFILLVLPKTSVIRNRCMLEVTNDHFIAVIKK